MFEYGLIIYLVEGYNNEKRLNTKRGGGKGTVIMSVDADRPCTN